MSNTVNRNELMRKLTMSVLRKHNGLMDADTILHRVKALGFKIGKVGPFKIRTNLGVLRSEQLVNKVTIPTGRVEVDGHITKPEVRTFWYLSTLPPSEVMRLGKLLKESFRKDLEYELNVQKTTGEVPAEK